MKKVRVSTNAKETEYIKLRFRYYTNLEISFSEMHRGGNKIYDIGEVKIYKNDKTFVHIKENLIKKMGRVLLKGINVAKCEFTEYFIVRKGLENAYFLNELLLNKFLQLHGSAVSDNKKGFIFIGPSGSGKTLLSLNLVKEGFKLVGDNYILTDGSKIKPVVGLIRIKKRDLYLVKKYELSNLIKRTNFVTFRKINFLMREKYLQKKRSKLKKVFILMRDNCNQIIKLKNYEKDAYITLVNTLSHEGILFEPFIRQIREKIFIESTKILKQMLKRRAFLIRFKNLDFLFKTIVELMKL